MSSWSTLSPESQRELTQGIELGAHSWRTAWTPAERERLAALLSHTTELPPVPAPIWPEPAGEEFRPNQHPSHPQAEPFGRGLVPRPPQPGYDVVSLLFLVTVLGLDAAIVLLVANWLARLIGAWLR